MKLNCVGSYFSVVVFYIFFIMFSFYYFGVSVLILHLITDVIYVTCTLFEFLFYFKLPGGE